ncbi:Neurotransmitter-gated ion-channel ligand binding domain protein [Ancylostoma duodenale]|uniref:Neurotransmitter-gated ion-channel ligand binding domain protein n=1 Tax=Ancylostoma duodenale TaxID=51022 RepID=A0A0C2DD78_9BILA|nr:Neurotransmitter-gated ion-channel ligand binding domain protein [Ancylostoma duodenale]
MTYYRFFLFSLLPAVTSSTAEVCECDTVEAPRAENIYAIDSRLKDVREPSYGPVTCVPDAKIVNYLLRPAAYSKHKLPYKTGVKVKVEFWIQEITAISEMTNDFEMEMYINELWSDPKLKFDHLNACKANLSLDQATLVRVWTPNSCFVNSKTAEIHDSPFTNVFLTLFENGTVWVNYRVRVKGPCSMNLVDFPMDTQSCRLKYQSFSYNNEEVRMRWNARRKPVFALKPIHISDFTLKEITPAVIRRNYPAGMWDELVVTFVFERRYMWYFLQAYLPTYFTIFIR